MMTPVAKQLLLKNMVSGAFVFRIIQLALLLLFLALFAVVVLYQADSTNMEDSVSTVSRCVCMSHARRVIYASLRFLAMRVESSRASPPQRGRR
jgi:hypothetical protein